MGAPFSPIDVFLAAVSATAAIHKIIERDRLARSAASLAGVPSRFGGALSYAAAATELTATVLLMVPAYQSLGAGIAGLLWSLYALLLWRARGRDLDCGCTWGPRRSAPSSPLRALILVPIAALAVLLPGPPSELLAGVAGLALFSLYVAANDLIGTAASSRRFIA